MIDSFGHYSVAQAPGKWTTYGGVLISVPETGSGFALRDGSASKTFPANYTTLAAGVRTLIKGTRDVIIFQNSLPGSSCNAKVTVEADGRLSVTCQSAGAALGSGGFKGFSTYAISFGAIYHFQFSISMVATAASAGRYYVDWTFNVLVNGVSRYSGTARTPPGTGGGGGDITLAYLPEVKISSGDGLGSWVGDFWCTDGELLGDCQIVPLFPRADGSTLQWTPLTPGTHFSEVNQHIADDTTYNYDSTAGDIDEYFMDLIGAFSGTIKGAQGVWRVENADAFSSLCQGIYRNGSGTEVLAPSGTFAPSLSSYQFFIDPNRKSVFTGVDWTQAEIDASQTGIKRIS